MTRARPKFTPTPRIWSNFQLACRLGKTEPGLATDRARLEAEGLPRIDPLLGGVDADAVETWLDRRSGIVVAGAVDVATTDPLMEALNDVLEVQLLGIDVHHVNVVAPLLRQTFRNFLLAEGWF